MRINNSLYYIFINLTKFIYSLQYWNTYTLLQIKNTFLHFCFVSSIFTMKQNLFSSSSFFFFSYFFPLFLPQFLYLVEFSYTYNLSFYIVFIFREENTNLFIYKLQPVMENFFFSSPKYLHTATWAAASLAMGTL